MAINKNDYLDGDGNYELKKSLVDELIDGFDNLTKDDVGLSKVINERQPAILHMSTTNGNVEVELPNKNGQFLLISSWTGQSSGGLWILTVRGNDVYIAEIKGDGATTISNSGKTLQINKTQYRFITLIDIY